MAGATPSSTHPPLPPTQEDVRLDWLRLLRSRRVGVATFWRLLSEHGSARAALEALPEVARAAGVENYEICPEGVVLAEVHAAQRAGARLLVAADPDYPRTLSEIAEAPPLLWIRGDAALLSRSMIALVGARNASSLGTRMARRLAEDLSAAGHVIVSGLARGIDAVAHQAALGGGTVAVMAGGVDVIYPAENTDLAREVAARGLCLSEQPMGLVPQARHFPSRNRIVAGLSCAVVVVEAAAKSGSLITARAALDQGRDVLAVPGHPFDARAAGCNMLIRDGAVLVRSASDVLEAIGHIAAEVGDAATAADGLPSRPARAVPPAAVATAPPPAAARSAAGRTLRETAALHRRILDRLGPSPMAEDQLIRDLGAAAQTVAPALVDLELDGRIQRAAGGLLSRIV